MTVGVRGRGQVVSLAGGMKRAEEAAKKANGGRDDTLPARPLAAPRTWTISQWLGISTL